MYNILSKLAGIPAAGIAKSVGKAAGSLMNRIGFTEKLSEAERIDKYSQLFAISEKSTKNARALFIAEMATQKQPYLIKILNGLVRPSGGLIALFCESYSILGPNVEAWVGINHVPIVISTESHLVLGAIIAFYFGSRLSETVKGVSTKR